MLEPIVILLPVYECNYDFLKEQLLSIARQTYSEFNCVVSCDGESSLVNLSKIRLLLPDKRFALITQPMRLGLYKHIEKLVSDYAFNYRYFLICDQDDVWLQERLTKQLDRINSTNVSVVSSNGLIVDENLDSIKQRTNFDWFGIRTQNIRFGLVLNQLTGASGMYRSKDFVKSLPFPRMVNNKVCVHDHWLYLCAVSTGGIEFSNEILWKYRQHEHNLIGASANSPLLFRYLRGLFKMLNIITNRFVKSSDPVIHQGLIFQSELSSRYTFTLINERLDLIGAVGYRGISKLKLDVIRMTRLEALRLYLHRGDGS
jgi:hypothetical protein